MLENAHHMGRAGCLLYTSVIIRKILSFIKMKSVRRRHPELAPASPHKLRHTGATLAKQAGVSLEAFSEALTHSDKEITKTYVNIKDKVCLLYTSSIKPLEIA